MNHRIQLALIYGTHWREKNASTNHHPQKAKRDEILCEAICECLCRTASRVATKLRITNKTLKWMTSWLSFSRNWTSENLRTLRDCRLASMSSLSSPHFVASQSSIIHQPELERLCGASNFSVFFAFRSTRYSTRTINSKLLAMFSKFPHPDLFRFSG